MTLQRTAVSVLILAGAGCTYKSRGAEANRTMTDEPVVNQLTAEEIQDGWELLFDGESLDGWRGFRRDDAPGSWRAVDGTLRFAASEDRQQRGDLMTSDEFGDFELTLDWKLEPAGNSGVMFRVTEGEDQAWKTGTEMQILDNAGHRDGQNPLTSAGSNYALYAPSADVTRPIGEWNTARIRAVGADVRFWLNGTPIVTFKMWSDDWEERVRNSKFVERPQYGRARSGHIDLQDHGNPVWYRNLKIRRLR